MKDVCILFPYHLDDWTTRHNYDILKKNNPGVDVHPLIGDCRSSPYLPDTFDLSNPERQAVPRPEDRDKLYYWSNCDLLIYDFFLNYPEQYQRYVNIEYDTICNISVRKLHQENWDDDLVCKSPKKYEDRIQTWDHFTYLNPGTRKDYLSVLGPEYLAGVVPLCGVLASLRCLREVVKNIQARPDVFRNMFSEIRMATAARLSNIKATVGRGLADAPLFNWFSIPFQAGMTSRPGIYHGIKSVPLGQGKKPGPDFLGDGGRSTARRG